MINLHDAHKFWLWVSEYYQYKFTEQQLTMYSEDIESFNPIDLKRAFITYRRDPCNRFMPTPSQIIGQLTPNISHRSLAVECAERIHQAIIDYGTGDIAKALEFIGELGRAVVEREGGWIYVCRNSKVDDRANEHARWRDAALSILERSQYGLHDIPPALPAPKEEKRSLDNFVLVSGEKKEC